MSDLEQLKARVSRLEKLLSLHHTHHLMKGTIGVPDGEGGWIEIDNAAEYADSTLFEMTVKALNGEEDGA